MPVCIPFQLQEQQQQRGSSKSRILLPATNNLMPTSIPRRWRFQKGTAWVVPLAPPAPLNTALVQARRVVFPCTIADVPQASVVSRRDCC